MVDSVVSGFSGAPALLLIVILNIAAMGFAGYYLVHTDSNRNTRLGELLQLLKTCMETQKHV